MKKQLIKWLKILTLTGAFALFGVFLFVIYTLSEIPLERLDAYKPINGPEEIVSLEEGSLVHKEELRTFYLFNRDHRSLERFWNDLLNSNKVNVLDQDLVSINEKLDLKELATNHCGRVYCFQHRMEFKNIPSLFWKGLIGIEDFRYLSHFGIDIRSILRALITDLIEMRFVQGGSTLTQQLAKNLYFSNEKTLIRKVKEMIVAIYIESKYSKEDILEAYFNEFVWGSLQGIRIKGLYSASIFYFGERPHNLSPYQASILIAILNGPYFFHPIRNLDRLIKKTNVLYRKLVQLKLFSGNFKWDRERWESWREELILRNKRRDYHSLWRSQSLKKAELSSYENFVLVNKATKVLSELKEKNPKQDLAIKILLGDPFKIGSEKLFFYSKFERDQYKAIKSERHQVGSTLKPLIYSLILKDSDQFDEMVSTEKLTLELKSGDWSPREAHKNLPKEVKVKEALLKSYNRPLIRLARDHGFSELEARLDEYIPRLQKPLSEFPAQLLGAVELSVNELFNAYSLFLKGQCNEIKKTSKENILYLLSDPKRTTVRRQVGKLMGDMRFFGKTGTSNNGYDNWYLSFDGQMLGIIWVGLEGPRLGEDTNLYGGSTAFKIFRDFSRDRGSRFHELSCPEIPGS